MNKSYTFHVSGTHCASCKIFIEDTLKEQGFIKKVQLDLKSATLQVETEQEYETQALAQMLTNKIKKNGYAVLTEKSSSEKKDQDKNDVIWQALPLGLGFLFLFFLLQKSGILNIGIGGQVTPVTSFIVGLVASVSSCLAVVGGLVLSLSAKISQDKYSDTRTFILFHSGRIFSFAVLGGVLGLLGGVIGVNFLVTSILGILASMVMLVLGLNLIGVFKKNKITMHSSIFNFFRKIEHNALTPFILGFATFFLPCGFTQSMQVLALSSGSFISGFAIMLSFAVGTFPVLAFLSFGSGKIAQGRNSVLFFKTAGVVVIGLGLFALLAGLASLGIINPLVNI